MGRYHTLGGGALEDLDLRLGKHLGECGGALHVHLVALEAAHS